MLQPLLVRPRERGGFEIVAGERRSRVAQLAGLAELHVVVRDVGDEDAGTLALVENVQREDLNPVDRADAISRLVAQALGIPLDRVPAQLSALRKHPEGEGHPEQITRVESVFAVVGGSWKSFFTHLLPVLRFPEDVLQALRSGQLEYTKGAVIARIKDPRERQRLLQLALSGVGLEELRTAARPPVARHAPVVPTQRVIKALKDPSRLERLEPEAQSRVAALLAELDALLAESGERKARSSPKRRKSA